MTDAKKEIQNVLSVFQQGYESRDLTVLDDFMAGVFAAGEDVVVIGTGAVFSGGYEWCQGAEEVREIIAEDWVSWGDLSIDIENTRISINDKTAWVAIPGLVSRTMDADDAYESAFEQIEDMLGEEEDDYRFKLHQIRRLASEALYETEFGDDYIWPIRITGVLTLEQAGWRFRQLHFAFPNTNLPDERVISPDFLAE